jgi:hypothetical protein
MSSKTTRLVGGLVVIAVAIVLLAVLKKGDSSSDPTNSSGKVPTIVIEHGKPVGGIRDLTYNKGEQIHFIVDSDVSDEVHMHGYDIMKDVKAGGTVSFDFPASIEGVFEAELEGRKEQIVELTVNP